MIPPGTSIARMISPNCFRRGGRDVGFTAIHKATLRDLAPLDNPR